MKSFIAHLLCARDAEKARCGPVLRSLLSQSPAPLGPRPFTLVTAELAGAAG